MKPRAIKMVALQVDKERHLVLDMAALFRAEQRFRQLGNAPTLSIWDILAGFVERGGKIGLTEVVVFVHAALVHEDPALTEDAVLGWLSIETLPQFVTACTEAILAAFPKAVEGKEEAAAPAGRPFVQSTGSSGGASRGKS